MSNYKVSVIICTMNCDDSIEECITSAVNNKPFELIVVDGKSKDDTMSIVRKYTNRVYTDPGRGLAKARNMGFSKATGDYIFYLGSDNVIAEGTLEHTVEYMATKGLVGCALPTRLRDPSNYCSKGLDFRWKTRFFEGEREVIGTPSCWTRAVLAKFPFDDNLSWSDDTDIGARLKEEGHKVAYSSLTCYEIGFSDWRDIVSRFRLYGLSDFEYYNKYKDSWTRRRRGKSLLHPIHAEIVDPLRYASPLEAVYFIPFLLWVCLNRIVGFRVARKRFHESTRT